MTVHDASLEIPDDDPVFGWAALAVDFDPTTDLCGEPSVIVHDLGETDGYRIGAIRLGFSPEVHPETFTVDRLAHYGPDGTLDGILFRYRDRIYDRDGYLAEVPDTVTISVRPDRRRQGVGIALAREADRRWAPPLGAQRVTAGGRAIALRIAQDRKERNDG